MDKNLDKRDTERIKYKSPVTIENLKAGILYQARMLNYSKNGLYFESDTMLRLGEEVFIGVEYSPYADSRDMYECFRAKIMWRRELPDSLFKFGYGVTYSIDYEKQRARNGGLKIVDDQRKHQRKPYSKYIKYSTQSEILRGLIKDINPSGVFIETDDILEVGQSLTLSIPLKQAKHARIEGQVVWAGPEGFGVKFLRIKK